MKQDSEIANAGAEIRHFPQLQGLRPGAGFGGSIVTIASRCFGSPGILRTNRKIRKEGRMRAGMRLLFCGFAIVAVSLPVAGQSEKSFPTDDEIRLVLTQTERAVQQYSLVIEQEASLMGSEGAPAAAKDREVAGNLETAIKGFRLHPQAFNGHLGFVFFEWLDDASRNANLCAMSATAEIMPSVGPGQTSKAQSLLRLAQSCSDMATLFYTVSENAGALYLRYVTTEEDTANRCGTIVEQCTSILKKQSGTSPK
jgi:hypothetical protein